MKNQVIGVYCITNVINNKKYIGSSIDIGKRFKRHISMLSKQIHKNKHLQASLNKYKIESFTFSILEECNEENLIQREQYYIDSFNWNDLYNMTKIANGGGADVGEIPLYLLDLEGNIVHKYKSGAELARNLELSIAPYTTINTFSILKSKYRVVTVKYYNENLEIILTWKNYSNKTNSTISSKRQLKYILTKEEEKLYFTYMKEISNYLGISVERVRQLLKSNVKIHKRTGYTLATVRNS